MKPYYHDGADDADDENKHDDDRERNEDEVRLERSLCVPSLLIAAMGAPLKDDDNDDFLLSLTILCHFTISFR